MQDLDISSFEILKFKHQSKLKHHSIDLDPKKWLPDSNYKVEVNDITKLNKYISEGKSDGSYFKINWQHEHHNP